MKIFLLLSEALLLCSLSEAKYKANDLKDKANLGVVEKMSWDFKTVYNLQEEEAFQKVIGQPEPAIAVFGASWCPYTVQLQPIMEQAASSFGEAMKIRIINIDCARFNVCGKYGISKYPTIHMLKNKELYGKEFRSRRTVQIIKEWAAGLTAPAVSTVDSSLEFAELGHHSRVILGVFKDKDDPKYKIFEAEAERFKFDCHFHVTYSPGLAGVGHNELPMVMFKAKGVDLSFHGSFDDNSAKHSEFYYFVRDHCRPLIDELTFQNAEEKAELGKPFLMLFYDPDTKKSVDEFKEYVTKNLANEFHRVSFLIADGKVFQHPIHHLGKTAEDLPFVALDSFKHIYEYDNGLDFSHLQQYIDDNFNGVLHNKFHAKQQQEMAQIFGMQGIKIQFIMPGEHIHGGDGGDNQAKKLELEGGNAGVGEKIDEKPRDIADEEHDGVVDENGQKVPNKDKEPVKVKIENPRDSVFERLKPSNKKYSTVNKHIEL